MYKKGILVVMVLALIGCASLPPNDKYFSDKSDINAYPPIKHEVVPGMDSRIKSLGCDREFYYKNDIFNKKEIGLISDNYIYALIVSNTYRTSKDFNIDNINGDSGYKYVSHYRGVQGFAADIYQSKQEVVISFRGTDDASDTIYVNSYMKNNVPSQYLNALKLTKKIIEKNKNKKVVLVGHSMGGGLALQTAIKMGVHAVVFNSSFKVWLAPEDDITKASWVEIDDKHDKTSKYSKAYQKIIKLRSLDKNPNRQVLLLNFMDSIPIAPTIKSSRDHSIYYIARGMLLIASKVNPIAEQILNENVMCDNEIIKNGVSEKN